MKNKMKNKQTRKQNQSKNSLNKQNQKIKLWKSKISIMIKIKMNKIIIKNNKIKMKKN